MLKKNMSRFLILSVLLNNIYSYSNAANLEEIVSDRYQTLEGSNIFIEDSVEGNLEEIEIFGNTVQDPDNLEDIQSVGDLYLDEKGEPILDKNGKKQYKIDIVSTDVYPIENGLISWVDAKYANPGDTEWKDLTGNGNDFVLKNFTNDGTNGFNGEFLKLINTRSLKVESRDYIKIKQCESYSLEMFFDGELINYLIGLQHNNSSSEKGSFLCTFGSTQNYRAAYDDKEVTLLGNFNKKSNHIVLVKDAKNNKFKVYLNTVLIHERDIIDGENSNNQKIQLGSFAGGTYVSNIKIYSHRRYNKALTESEILNNYNYELKNKDARLIENKVSILLPVQLMKVGSISDRLYWDKNKKIYVIEKNIKEEILDGSENGWFKSDTWVNLDGQNTISFQKPISGIVYASEEDIRIISDTFEALEMSSAATIIEDKEWIRPYSSTSENVGIRILKSKLSGESVDDFKKWLSNNPITVYYQLSIPIIINTEISEKFNILTYDGCTTIYTEVENNIKAHLKIVIDKLPQIAHEEIINAEESGLLIDISLARLYVNMLPDSLLKDQLQEKLNSIFSSEMVLDKKTVSNNIDLYVKSENMLSMSLSANSVTFENYSGVEDMELLNAVNITVHSSLPYGLNVYMPSEIHNSDKTNSMDIGIFNIRENTKIEYQKFANTTDKLILNDNCGSGNDKYHSIDLKLSGNNANVADVYKTVLKFEVEQK